VPPSLQSTPDLSLCLAWTLELCPLSCHGWSGRPFHLLQWGVLQGHPGSMAHALETDETVTACTHPAGPVSLWVGQGGGVGWSFPGSGHSAWSLAAQARWIGRA
jgi:hypothetical protein